MNSCAFRSLMATMIVFVLPGCARKDAVNHGVWLVNQGDAVIYHPTLEYGAATVEAGGRDLLEPGLSHGGVGNFEIPRTARLQWIVAGLECTSEFDTGTIKPRDMIDHGRIYFRVRKFESDAYFQRSAGDAAVTVPRRSQRCIDASWWSLP